MKFPLFTKGILFGLALLGASGLARPAAASFIVDIAQQGGNVVATGAGTINLTALSDCCGSNPPPDITGVEHGEVIEQAAAMPRYQYMAQFVSKRESHAASGLSVIDDDPCTLAKPL